MHWPANAGGEHPNVETILNLPGVRNGCLLICADSARYWYRQARGACPLVVWRSIPRIGKRPAELGWEPNRVADEVLNLWDEQPHVGGTEWLLPLNELQFAKESGEVFPGYARTAEHLGQLRLQLRRKLTQQYPNANVKLMFPAWVPTDDLEHPDEWRSEAQQWDALCFVPDQRVTARQPTVASMRYYEGDVVTIQTTSGNQLTVTPNHPILTCQGWLPAGEINEGMEVAEYTGQDGVLGRAETNDIQVPTPISEIFGSLLKSYPNWSRRGLRQDFHGDGFDSNVNIVSSDRSLGSSFAQPLQDLILPYPLAGSVRLPRLGDTFSLFTGSRSGTGNPGSVGISLPTGTTHGFHNTSHLLGQLLGTEGLRLTPRSHRPATTTKQSLDPSGIPTETLGDIQCRFPGQVSAVRVLHVNRRRYSGHVHNLTTQDGLIIADGIITHNCLHAYGSAGEMSSRYLRYRDAFPDMPIFIGEWNANHTGADERTSLSMWAYLCTQDSRLMGAAYYVWETRNDNEGDFSVWGNPDRLVLFENPPVVDVPAPDPKPEPVSVTWNRADLIKLISDKALAAGLEPYELLGGAIAESNLDPNAFRQGDWPDVSAGMFQQTVAFAKEGDHSQSPQNVALIRQLYSDPVHATDVAIEQYSYWRRDPDVLPLTAWAAYNGGGGFYKAWYDSPNLQNYRRGLLEAASLLMVKADVSGADLGVTIPPEVIRQQTDWTCSVRSTYAALWAIDTLAGRTPLGYDEVYQAMVPKLADASVGLHRADGSELAVLLQARGLTVETVVGASLPRVQARAGKKLVLLGFSAWGPAGHWVFCHGVSDDGVLQLANPAGTYQGIGDILRDTFPKLGSCTMLAIDIPTAAPVPVPVPVPVPTPVPVDPRVTELEAQVAQLTTERDQALAHTAPLIEGLAYVGDDVMDAIQAAVDAARRVRTERVGPRPTKA